MIHTRVITPEQIAPSLTLKLQALEESLGLALTPPAPPLPLHHQAAAIVHIPAATAV